MDNNQNPNSGWPFGNGQPTQGQPVQGQPTGQPMQQPVQGQPVQQPVQGQPEETGPKIGVVPFLTPIGIEQPPVPGTVPGTMPIQATSGQSIQGQPAQPGQAPNNPQAVTSSANERTAMEKVKVSHKELIKTIAIVTVSLLAVTFIGLFIWKAVAYEDISSDVNARVNKAVAVATDEQAIKLENEFLVREKYPYRSFTGPADYGQLTFEYPKTWSLYIATDASKGGDYNAYFNPIEVNTVGTKTLMALRLSILDKSFENVISSYQSAVSGKNPKMYVEAVEFAGITANRYTGNIPGTEFNGFIVVFKIRDKTVVLQTDSVLFQQDFDQLLTTIKFNA